MLIWKWFIGRRHLGHLIIMRVWSTWHGMEALNSDIIGTKVKVNVVVNTLGLYITLCVVNYIA